MLSEVEKNPPNIRARAIPISIVTEVQRLASDSLSPKVWLKNRGKKAKTSKIIDSAVTERYRNQNRALLHQKENESGQKENNGKGEAQSSSVRSLCLDVTAWGRDWKYDFH